MINSTITFKKNTTFKVSKKWTKLITTLVLFVKKVKLKCLRNHKLADSAFFFVP